MTPMADPLRLLLAALVVTAGAWDLRSRRIPNALTIPALAAGIVLQWLLHGWAGLADAALGAAAALAITLPLFALRGLGGGDVKLMAAAGVMTGPRNFLVIFLLNALLGGIVALVLVMTRGRLVRTLRNTAAILGQMVRGRAPHAANADLDIGGQNAVTLAASPIFAIAALAGLFAAAS